MKFFIWTFSVLGFISFALSIGASMANWLGLSFIAGVVAILCMAFAMVALDTEEKDSPNMGPSPTQVRSRYRVR